jgi:hypothetical protein
MPYYSVTIVYRDGACQCHSGMIGPHALAMYKHAITLPEINYVQVSVYRGVSWNRMDYHIAPSREGE